MSKIDTTHDDLLLVKRACLELPYITSSYALLMQRYQRLMHYVSMGILIEAALVDDAVQDIMLKVFHKLPGFEQRSSFKTWLMSITVNTCISYNRKHVRESRYMDARQSYDEDSITTSENQGPDHDEFQKLVQSLNEEERQIMTLKFIAELEFNEIAKLVNIGLSATKMRYYRAIEKLKESL